MRIRRSIDIRQSAAAPTSKFGEGAKKAFKNVLEALKICHFYVETVKIWSNFNTFEIIEGNSPSVAQLLSTLESNKRNIMIEIAH